MPLLDDLTGTLKNLYGNGGAGDPLISIGMGLLSQRGVGRGLAAGFQNAAQMSDIANQRNRQAMLDKLAQERETRAASNEAFRQQYMIDEAKRQQANSDRTFAQGQQQLNQPHLIDVPQSDGTTVKQWITPGGAPGAVVGAPVKQRTPATDALEKENAEFEARDAQLRKMNLDPNEPRNQQYRLTGRFPREDAQPLTATDKKAIYESDEGVFSAQKAIDALNQAKKLSPKAYGGMGATTRAALGAGLPDWAVLDFIAAPKASEDTQNLDNLIGQNALGQLKEIFGGNPTEGERAILLELQGASGKSDAVRQKIYDRAIELAQRRLEFNRQRAQELRGGTYYAPKSGPEAAATLPVPSVSYPSWSIEK